MKTATMMTMAAMLGSMAWAGGKSGNRKVVACLEESGGILADVPKARMIAIEVFQSAGVNLEMLTGLRSCEGQRDQAILVSVSMNTPSDLPPGVLARALLFEGLHIRVFYDRIVSEAHDRQLRPYLLAYVIVHEITHILEGVDRHSDSGIMKAHWGSDEYALMRSGQLRFAEEDIELIHLGLAAPVAHPASGALVAASGLAAAQPAAQR